MIRISDLNWGFLEILYLVIIFIIGFVITFLILPQIIKLMKKKGYIGIDIHKNSKPAIPESGGLSLVIGIFIASIFLIILFPVFLSEILIFTLTIILSGIIGFLDDRKKLRSIYKILLTMLTGLIIFIANLLGIISIQSPTIPYLGTLRLTLIYPLVVPIVVAVFANTINMLEGYNGEGSGTSIIALSFLLICSLIWNSAEGLIFTIISLSVIIPFFLFNKFPAKIFPGDVGTLSIGAMFSGIALFGSLEAAVFCALLIQVFNSFYVLYSVKGFFESSEIQENMTDIILLKNDTIKASDSRDAALTLPRLILAKGPLSEKQIVLNFYLLAFISGIFSIITTLFMSWTLGNLDSLVLLISIFTAALIISIIYYFYKRLRGIINLMLILMIGGYLLLILIEIFIMPLSLAFNIFGLEIPVNILVSLLIVIPCMLLWYFISIKYFWREIKKMQIKESVNRN